MAEKDLQQLILQATLDEVKTTHQDEKEPCVICLDAIKEQAVALPCNHAAFDFLCLVSWLQEQTSCPLCKTQVTSVSYERRSEVDYKTYEVSQVPSQSSPTYTPRHNARPLPRRRPQPRPWGPDPRAVNPEAVTADAAVLRRKRVYRHSLYSLHVGSNRLSRYSTLSPVVFNRDSGLISRARNFIRRELQVFDFLNQDAEQGSSTATRRANNAEFLLEYIIAILKTIEIKGSSGQAAEMLGEFIGRDNARLFLHELSSWLRSPYTRLQDWDRHVQYNESNVAKPRQGRSLDDLAPSSKFRRSNNGTSQNPSSFVRRNTHRFVDRYVPDYTTARRPRTYGRDNDDPG